MPQYMVQHYTAGKWVGDTGADAPTRKQAIRQALAVVAAKFPYWGEPDAFIVYRDADTNNASRFIRKPGSKAIVREGKANG